MGVNTKNYYNKKFLKKPFGINNLRICVNALSY